MNQNRAPQRFGFRRASLFASLAWVAGLAAVLAVAALSARAGWTALGYAMAAGLVPALLLPLADRFSRQEWLRVLTLMGWTGLAMGACAAMGAESAAAAWFLAPVLAALSLRRERLLPEAAGLAALGVCVTATISIGGFAPQPLAVFEGLGPLPLLPVLLLGGVSLWSRAGASRNRRDDPETLIAEAPLGVLKADLTGHIRYASPRAVALFGEAAFRVEGAGLADLAMNDADESALSAELDRVAAERQDEAILELATPGGRAELRLVRIEDFIAIAALDVTSRAAQERRAYEERDQAIAANNAKSRFLAGMSHEIRTPLNAVIGFSDIMKQRLFGPLPARYAEYADLIHESGRHLLDLVGDVLDMSKIEADRYELRRERFDARDIAATAVKLMKLRAEEGKLRLSLDSGMSPLPVDADRKALRQIALNLLSNAVKFTPPGGAVRVAIAAEAGDLVLEVSDSGAGMSADELTRIGLPYQQTASAAANDERGSGLGLSLVAALTDLHGGDFELESEPSEGTTARVRLPVLASDYVDESPDRMDARARIEKVRRAGAEIHKSSAAGAKR